MDPADTFRGADRYDHTRSRLADGPTPGLRRRPDLDHDHAQRPNRIKVGHRCELRPGRAADALPTAGLYGAWLYLNATRPGSCITASGIPDEQAEVGHGSERVERHEDPAEVLLPT